MNNRTRLASLVCIFIGATAALCLSGAAATVVNCTEADLRTAVTRGGTITFGCDGVIFLSATILVEANTVLDGTGRQVTIDGADSVRIFNVNTGVALTVINLTLSRGNSAEGTNANGGSVCNNRGILEMTHCTVQASTARNGGGIYNDHGTINLTSCSVISNIAGLNLPGTAMGGGLYNEGGTVFLNDCTFSKNKVDVDFAYGGGIFQSSGFLLVSNSSFLENIGGGVARNDVKGGGLFVDSGSAEIKNSTFSQNSAGTERNLYGNGGGICNNRGVVSVVNSTFFNNSANAVANVPWVHGAVGGGFYNGPGNVGVTNCTFSGNSVNSDSYAGGNVWNDGSFILQNSILANSPAGGNGSPNLMDAGHNISSDASCNFTNQGSLNNTDPRLGPLADNGGTTKTMALLEGSLALDAGDPGSCPAIDQRGSARPIGPSCDIGAVETPRGVLEFAATNFYTSENAGTALISVRRTGITLQGQVSVSYVTSDLTATEGTDYRAATGLITFDPGETNKSFPVQILDDLLIESNKAFSIRLFNPTGGAEVGKLTNTLVTITNDDGPGSLQFRDAAFYVNEGSTEASIEVVRSGGRSGAVSVDYATSSGTAVDGFDFLSSTGTLFFAEGEISKTFQVSVQWDPSTESREWLSLSLSNPKGGATLGTPSMATLFILDNAPAHTVSVCDEGGLRAGIADGGLILVACDGTIHLSKPISITSGLTLDGNGHLVVLSGSNAVRVFNVSNDGRLILMGLTLANSRSPNGGAIYNDRGTVELLGCKLLNNSAIGSAGADGTNGAPGIDSNQTCPFTNAPTAGQPGGDGTDGESAGGGAIYNLGTLILSNSVLAGNIALGGNGGNGGNGGKGGDYCCREPSQGGRLFCRYPSAAGAAGGRGGAAAVGYGGAIFNGNTLHIFKSSLYSNEVAGGQGGRGGSGGRGGDWYGPDAYGGNGGSGADAFGTVIYNTGRVQICNSTFGFNAARGGDGGDGGGSGGLRLAGTPPNGGSGANAHGGGVFQGAGTLVLTNATFFENTVLGGRGGSGYAVRVNGDSYGGGFSIFSGDAYLLNGTFANNLALTNNGGLAFGGALASTNASVRLKNSILASSLPANNWGTLIDEGHNLASDSSCSFTNTGSLNNTLPKLGPLANNGGLTETMALEANSPALDAGDSSLCPTMDQRGHIRPAGPTCDIGAFEGTDGVVYPTITQTFFPNPLGDGEISTLTLRIQNLGTVPLTGISFTNHLALPLLTAPFPNTTTTCPGASIEGTPFGETIRVAGISLAPGENCSFSVDVMSWTAGQWNSFVVNLSADQFAHSTYSNQAEVIVNRRGVSVTAIRLDGADDFFETTNSYSNPQVFTVSLWFKTTTSSGGPLMAFASDLGWFDHPLFMNNQGELVFGGPCGSVKVIITTPRAYNDGLWHHVAAVRSGALGTNLALIVDGALTIGTYLGCGTGTSGHWTIGHAAIGDWPSAPSSLYFAGDIDEVQVWNVPRTESEIQQSFHRALLGTENDLFAYWRLDEGSGVTAVDASAHRNTGFLKNGAVWVESFVPIFDSVVHEGTTLGVRFPGVPGSSYILEASTDLITWTSIVTNTVSPNGLIEFNEDQVMHYRTRFFRVVAR